MRGERTIVKLNGVVVTDYDGVAPAPPKQGRYEPDRGPRPDTAALRVSGNSGHWLLVTRYAVPILCSHSTPKPADFTAIALRWSAFPQCFEMWHRLTVFCQL